MEEIRQHDGTPGGGGDAASTPAMADCTRPARARKQPADAGHKRRLSGSTSRTQSAEPSSVAVCLLEPLRRNAANSGSVEVRWTGLSDTVFAKLRVCAIIAHVCLCQFAATAVACDNHNEQAV